MKDDEWEYEDIDPFNQPNISEESAGYQYDTAADYNFEERSDWGDDENQPISPRSVGWQHAQFLTGNLKALLNGIDEQLQRERAWIRHKLEERKRPPVDLGDLLAHIEPLTPSAAILGWGFDQAPVIVKFHAHEKGHMLISGLKDAGKSMLLRALCYSLALSSRVSQVQLALIEGDHRIQVADHSGLQPFNHLPHMLMPVTTNAQEALDVLQFIGSEVQHRTEQGITTPTIVCVIDDVTRLIDKTAGHVIRPLTRLIRQGATAGVQVILSTNRPSHPLLDDLLEAYIPIRVVGQLATREDAAIAADAINTEAESLLGYGDFVGIINEQLVRFQAPFINDQDLRQGIEALQRHRPPPLIAWSFDPRQQLDPPPAVPTSQPEEWIAAELIDSDNGSATTVDVPELDIGALFWQAAINHQAKTTIEDESGPTVIEIEPVGPTRTTPPTEAAEAVSDAEPILDDELSTVEELSAEASSDVEHRLISDEVVEDEAHNTISQPNAEAEMSIEPATVSSKMERFAAVKHFVEPELLPVESEIDEVGPENDGEIEPQAVPNLPIESEDLTVEPPKSNNSIVASELPLFQAREDRVVSSQLPSTDVDDPWLSGLLDDDEDDKSADVSDQLTDAKSLPSSGKMGSSKPPRLIGSARIVATLSRPEPISPIGNSEHIPESEVDLDIEGEEESDRSESEIISTIVDGDEELTYEPVDDWPGNGEDD